MTKQNHTHKSQSGSIVPTIIIFLMAFMAIGTVTLNLITSNYFVAVGEDYAFQAQLAADAGADASVQALNEDANWPGTSGLQTAVTDSMSLRTTYESHVTPGIDGKAPKTIDIVGRSYSPATATKPRAERKIRVVVRGVSGGGNYSVVTGVGGLNMSNSAKITEGDVYINGGLTMDNSAQIGSTTKTVNVRVANARCPINTNSPDFPRVCNPGENNNPIQMNGQSSRIYGTVQGTHQTNGDKMLNPGLTSGNPPLANLPTHDRNAQKAAVTTTRSGDNSDAGCASNGAVRTWSANTKINGNVTVSHKCTITVHGDVWITGNLTLSQSSIIKVAEGISDPPVIMIDGSNGLTNGNSSILASNGANIGFRVITYWSAGSCSPDCSDVKGSDYQNSKDHTTISLDNSGSGPNTEFYARWSAVTVGNSGNIGAVAGQTVNLTNSAMITFGAQVSSMPTIPSTWVVQSYRRMY